MCVCVCIYIYIYPTVAAETLPLAQQSALPVRRDAAKLRYTLVVRERERESYTYVCIRIYYRRQLLKHSALSSSQLCLCGAELVVKEMMAVIL